jgi:hypothetical protein
MVRKYVLYQATLSSLQKHDANGKGRGQLFVMICFIFHAGFSADHKPKHKQTEGDYNI